MKETLDQDLEEVRELEEGAFSTWGNQSGTQSRLISYITKTTLQDAALACKN